MDNETNSTSSNDELINNKTNRINKLLHPKPPSFSDHVISGTKNGFIVGVGIGLTVPILLRGRVEPVSTFLKSVINATFIGTTFMATEHILQYQLLLPPMSSCAISGLVTGGTSAGLLAHSNFAKGMFAGGIFGAVGYYTYKKLYQDEINASLIKDIDELKQLVNDTLLPVELSIRDRDLYEKLIKGIDDRMNDPSYNNNNKPITFSSIIKTLNPLKEISDEEKKLILQKNKEKNDAVILDLKGRTTNGGYNFGNNNNNNNNNDNDNK